MDEQTVGERLAMLSGRIAVSEGEKLKEQYRQGAVDLDWVGHYRRYVSHMQQAISKRIETVTQIQQRLLEARQKLAEAAQQTKILEKLKDKRQSRYETELGKQQQREEDELGVKMFAGRESWA